MSEDDQLQEVMHNDSGWQRIKATGVLNKLHEEQQKVLSGYVGPALLYWFLWGISLLSAHLSQDNSALEDIKSIGLLGAEFSGGLIVWYLIVLATNSNYRNLLRKRLSKYHDQEKLLPTNHAEAFRIRHFVPWLFSFGYPSGRSSNHVELGIGLLAKNIDWFLKEPSRFWRLRWFYIYALIIPLMAFMFWLYYMDMTGYFPVTREFIYFEPSLVAYLSVCVLLCATAATDDLRRAIRIEVYRDFVLDYFKQHPVEPAND